jgi:hypothetical protein
LPVLVVSQSPRTVAATPLFATKPFDQLFTASSGGLPPSNSVNTPADDDRRCHNASLQTTWALWPSDHNEGNAMFLLSNIHNKPYATLYPDLKNVVFDMSDTQLSNVKNKDWHDIGKGSIVCIVNSTRMISTFYRIEENIKTDVVNEDGHQHVIRGTVIAKLPQDVEMRKFLNNAGVKHPNLPRNMFGNGFNVANLNEALDSVVLKTKKGAASIGDLKKPKA